MFKLFYSVIRTNLKKHLYKLNSHSRFINEKLYHTHCVTSLLHVNQKGYLGKFKHADKFTLLRRLNSTGRDDIESSIVDHYEINEITTEYASEIDELISEDKIDTAVPPDNNSMQTLLQCETLDEVISFD